MQVPVQAVAQQTPSAQIALVHSLPLAHAAPGSFKLVHDPESHLNPPAQLLSDEQVVPHATPEQA